ncbi:type VI secretion system Vgr family protein [Polyangium aurulentum]|uniref:type VI secretion system Vgr family protein n=1 Tax=Polyangium aurulentum TaxID=2567896 RepID=UPI0010AE9992|nr:type VI secretion system tip protein TssI/VgrG [Polyangium aurulentum]UQA59690.1 type VI secretion system tip protein VgrG [Polyangium aurulentum]
MADIFSFQSSALPDSAVLVGFKGREAMSELHRLRVFVTVPLDAGFVPADALWLKATISIDRGPGAPPHDIHGMVASVKMLLVVEERGLYEIVVLPRVHHLGLSRHSRVFTKQKIPDIIKELLEERGYAGDDVELRLRGKYPSEEHVCQYKESDFGFISRWMEREGMHYFFAHDDGVDKLVIGDDPSSNQPSGVSARYHPVPGDDVSASEFFSVFRSRTVVTPAGVRMADYDPARPSLDVSGRAEVSKVGLGEQSVFGARVLSPGEAKRIADVRAGEIRAAQTVYHAEGRVLGLRPGYTFALADHPRDALNRKYLCTALEHEANLRATTPEMLALTGLPAKGVYRCRATAIRADVAFRPPRTTPMPRVAGLEAAVVDSPGGSYGQIDDAGRYAVKMHFDEGDLNGGNASMRMRMMQPHAGSPEGFHFPLRKGTEVLVAFVGGDPDCPVIAGAAPNAHTPSPVTSSNHTLNVIHTGGDTHIQMQDLAGQQHIDIKTPPQNTFLHLGIPHGEDTHHIVANTAGDCLFEIGSNQDINVGGKLTEEVTGMVLETYKTSQDSEITGPQETTVTNPVIEIYKSTQTTEVTKKVKETHASLHLTVATGARTETYTDGQDTEVTGAKVEVYASTQKKTVTGTTQQIYNGPVITTVAGTVDHKVGGAVLQLHGPTMALNASLKLTCPGDANVFASKWEFIGQKGDFWSSVVEANKGKKSEHTGTHLALLGIKAEAGVIAIAGNGVKLEGAYFVLTRTGAALSGYGIRLTCNPVSANTRIFKKL